MILPPASVLVEVIRGVSDAADRATLGLTPGAATDRLKSSLDALSGALSAADAIAADKALTSARSALSAFQATAAAGDAPDVSAIDNSLLIIEQSLKRPCASTPAAPSIASNPASSSTSPAAGGRASLSCSGSQVIP
ncbi:MAG: hypothetical protein JWO05_1096 [Gemmatimonadetes bacterium]|nr:hypothetical protein [Gemmatimonadota bacterium]